MTEEFKKQVSHGLRLTKRLYYGPDPNLQPLKPHPPMEAAQAQAQQQLLPTGPTMYAVIHDPSVVDNPDVPSYQPYVHGRCNPPALMPLHMLDINVQVECFLDTAFVSLKGVWTLHCVSRSRKAECLIALPLGDKGSVLGFEVEGSRGSYHTQLLKVEDAAYLDGFSKAEYGGFINPSLFTLRIPKVDGGSKISVKARWSQKLLYHDGHFWLSLPFSFPAYVTPVGKFSGSERIQLNVNTGTGTEVVCKPTTRPLKVLNRGVGKLGVLYEAEVHTWSQTNFEIAYTVQYSDIHGGLLGQAPPPDDFDRRELFALYLFPGDLQNQKVFRKRVVFLVDISGSMRGAPIENVKKAVSQSLTNLNQDDSFNIVAFNKDSHLFSSSMVLATQEALQQASEWMDSNFTPEGDTNILLPVTQALEMLSLKSNSMSFVFLITDGAVDNERDICDLVKDHCQKEAGVASPRFNTFGIGSYCNHYFLKMLAEIGRGHFDAAYDADMVAPQLQRFCRIPLSVILTNIQVDSLNHLDSHTLYPSSIQDLSYGQPVIISGRYKGKLPELVKLRGTLADMTEFVIDIKLRTAKDIPLDKVFAQRQIDTLTAVAWFIRSKDLEKQAAEISMQTSFPSEYTRMLLVYSEPKNQELDSILIQGKEAYDKTSLEKMISFRKIIPLPSLGMGFGDLKKTVGNLPPGVIIKEPDATDLILKSATDCCHEVLDRVCCMCFIQTCSKMSDRCVITLSQICAALSCFQCLECCYDLWANCG